MRALLLVFSWFVVVGPVEAQEEGMEQARPRLLVAFQPGVSAQERERVLREMGLSGREVLDLDSMSVEFAEPRAGLLRAASLDEVKSQPSVAVVEEDIYYPNWLLDTGPLAAAPFPSMEQFRAAFRTAPPAPAAGVPVAIRAPSHEAGDGSDQIPWGVRRVHAPSVWRRDDGRTEGEGVRVAVLDSGIDCSHPDLQCDLSDGYNAIDPSKTPADDGWHGTHVAAIIAAKGVSGGVVGVAPRAKLIPIKVLDAKGGSAVSDIVRGIVWAAHHNVQIANMSIGAPVSSSILHMAIIYARLKGVTFIAAAGNRGPAPNTVMYPGAYSEVISVAASGQNADGSDSVSMFSSRGPQVSFIEPGANILSCIPGGGYAWHSGTSMSAPHLAGLATIAVAFGASGPGGIESALRKAAHPIGTFPADQQGAGMVVAEQLVPGPVLALNP